MTKTQAWDTSGRVGFKADAPRVPSIPTGFGSKNNGLSGHLAYNKDTKEFMLGGEVLKSLQEVSNKRDRMTTSGSDDPFRESQKLAKGFLPLNDEALDITESKLGYLHGLWNVPGRAREQKRMIAEAKKIKDSKKRNEYLEKRGKEINNIYPVTDSGQLDTDEWDILDSPFTRISRSARELANPETLVEAGLERAGQVIGGGLGAVAGGGVGSVATGTAGAMAGGGAGNVLSKAIIGNESTVAEQLHQLQQDGVEITDKVISQVEEEVSKGNKYSAGIAGLTGGLGGVLGKGFKVGKGAGTKQFTKKQLAEQVAKKKAVSEFEKTGFGKAAKRLDRPILGSSAEAGVEGIYAGRGATLAGEGRETTLGEDLKAFSKAATEGLGVAGAMHLPGYTSGLASSKIQKAHQKRINKAIVNNLSDGTDEASKKFIQIKAMADQTDFDTAKNSLKIEYGNLSKQNVDLNNKISSDYGSYLNQIKRNKRKAKTPESVEKTVNFDEKLDVERQMQKEFDEYEESKKSDITETEILPTDEDIRFLRRASLKNGIEKLKQAPWSKTKKQSLFNELKVRHKLEVDDLISNETKMDFKDVFKDSLKSERPNVNAKKADFDAIYDISQMTRSELGDLGVKLNIPDAIELSKTQKGTKDLINGLNSYFGKGVGYKPMALNVKGVEINVPRPKESRGKNVSSQKKHEKHLQRFLQKKGIEYSHKKGELTFDGNNINKLKDIINEKYSDYGISYEMINSAYKKQKMNISGSMLADLAYQHREKIRHYTEENNRLKEKGDKGLFDAYRKKNLSGLSKEESLKQSNAINKTYNEAEMKVKDWKAYNKIFREEVGKLKGLRLSRKYISKNSNYDGIIDFAESTKLKTDVIKVAMFKDEKALRRIFRHEISHYIIEKALTSKEYKMFYDSLGEGGSLHKKTLDYIKSRYEGAKLNKILRSKKEFGAEFLEGAWSGKIDLQPKSPIAKAIAKLKEFFSKVKKGFTGEVNNVHELVALVQLGRLERGRFIKIEDGRVKPGESLKSLSDDIANKEHAKEIEEATIKDMMAETNEKQDTLNQLIYEGAVDRAKKEHPTFFKINKLFNQNAVLVARKDPAVRNVFTFVDKMSRKIELIKTNLKTDLNEISNLSNDQSKFAVSEFLVEYENGLKGDSTNPISRLMSNMGEFVENGTDRDISKYDSVVNSLRYLMKEDLSKGKFAEPHRVFSTINNSLMNLVDTVVGHKYKKFLNLAADYGHKIALGDVPSIDKITGEKTNDFTLPIAAIDEKTNLFDYLNIKEGDNLSAKQVGNLQKQKKQIKQYIQDMLPNSVKKRPDAKIKAEPVLGAVAKLSYILQLGYKLSSLPVNIIGGVTSAVGAALRHGGAGDAIRTIANFAMAPAEWSSYKSKESGKGEYGKYYQKADKEGLISGSRQAFEGDWSDLIRSSKNERVNTFLKTKRNLVEKYPALAPMYLVSTANKMQRKAVFKSGIQIAKKKGLTDFNDIYNFAANYTNEGAGDFRNFARKGSTNPIWRILNQFKAEPQYMMQNMIALGRENPKALGGMVGLLVLNAGATGIPYMEDFLDFLDTLFAASGETGNIRKYASNAINNMTGSNIGSQIMYGVIAPGIGIGYSLSGDTTTLGLASKAKEFTKKRPSISSFDLIPSVGIFTKAVGQGIKGLSGKKAKQDTGIFKRAQAIKNVATEGYDEELISKIFGLSPASSETYYDQRNYFAGGQ